MTVPYSTTESFTFLSYTLHTLFACVQSQALREQLRNWDTTKYIRYINIEVIVICLVDYVICNKETLRKE